MTTNVPGGQQQHSHYDRLAAVDRCRRCRSSTRKIDLDTLVSFYFTPFLTCFRWSIPPSLLILPKFFPHRRGLTSLNALHTVAKTITSSLVYSLVSLILTLYRDLSERQLCPMNALFWFGSWPKTTTGPNLPRCIGNAVKKQRVRFAAHRNTPLYPGSLGVSARQDLESPAAAVPPVVVSQTRTTVTKTASPTMMMMTIRCRGVRFL